MDVTGGSKGPEDGTPEEREGGRERETCPARLGSGGARHERVSERTKCRPLEWGEKSGTLLVYLV